MRPSDRVLREGGRVCRLAGWLGLVAIVELSLVPGSERPHSGMPGRYEHVVAYAMTAAAFGLGYRHGGTRARLVALLVVVAGLLEIAQIWIPGRMAHWLDAAAGGAGALIGMSLAALLGAWRPGRSA